MFIFFSLFYLSFCCLLHRLVFFCYSCSLFEHIHITTPVEFSPEVNKVLSILCSNCAINFNIFAFYVHCACYLLRQVFLLRPCLFKSFKAPLLCMRRFDSNLFSQLQGIQKKNPCSVVFGCYFILFSATSSSNKYFHFSNFI